MSDGWLERLPESSVVVEHQPHRMCGSSWTDPGAPPRVTLHTTESDPGSLDIIESGWDQADAQGRLTVPQFTLDAKLRRVIQHGSVFQPACALEGCSSGVVQTNGVPNVQVELIGRAPSSQTWPDEWLRFIADWLVAVRAEGFAVPLSSSLTFYGQDAGFTLASYDARQRLSPPAWRAYTGLVGHQHVPCNAHWDPGKLNVARILEWAHLIEGGGDDMAAEDVAAINAHTDQVVNTLRGQLGQDETDTRLYEGLVPQKLPESPKQYLVVWDSACGWVKRWIRSGGELVSLMNQGTVQRAAASIDGGKPVGYVIPHGEALDWLRSLPEV